MLDPDANSRSDITRESTVSSPDTRLPVWKHSTRSFPNSLVVALFVAAAALQNFGLMPVIVATIWFLIIQSDWIVSTRTP